MKAAPTRRLEQTGDGVRDLRAARRALSGSPPGFGLFLALTVFTLLSIPNRIEAIGFLRPSMVLIALIATLIAFSGSYRESGDGSKTTRYLTILLVYILLTLPFVQWPGSVLGRGFENLLKAVVFFYFAVFLIDSLKRLQTLIAVILGCQVIRVLEPLYLHVTTGYWGSRANMSDGQFLARLGGGPHDFINPNGLAFVILTALPFLHYLLGGSPRKLFKVLYALLLPALLYAFVLTGSRSGLIGLMVVAAFIIWRSPHRAALTGASSVIAVVMVVLMSADMQERYLSLAESGTRHSSTRDGRIEGTKRELQVGLRQPLFGHGLGTSAEAMYHFGGRAQIAHNLYTETLIELGIVGLLLYLRVLASIIQNVNAVGPTVRNLKERLAQNGDEAVRAKLSFFQRIADAILAWAVMCLVFSMASYGLSEFYWYMIGGISVALSRVVAIEMAKIGDPALLIPHALMPRSRAVGTSRHARTKSG